MSDETISMTHPSDQAIALFLQENDADTLTDILVEALYEALRTLEDEIGADTLH